MVEIELTRAFASFVDKLMAVAVVPTVEVLGLCHSGRLTMVWWLQNAFFIYTYCTVKTRASSRLSWSSGVGGAGRDRLWPNFVDRLETGPAGPCGTCVPRYKASILRHTEAAPP